MSISQAVNLLTHRPSVEPARVESRSVEGRGPREVRDGLLSALIGYDEAGADRLLEEAFAVYGLESVTAQVLAPAMVQLGDMWHEGRTSTAAEHFASNYVRRKLDAIINAAPQVHSGPLVVLGCAPGDWHELGLLLIHMMLRRRNVNTIYLGQNVPLAHFIEEMMRLRPAMIIMAATTVDAVPGLIDVARGVQEMPGARPLFAFGGRVFNVQPELRTRVAGVFLGENAGASVDHILALISAGTALGPTPILRIRRGADV
jgi:MerR family transcriptional regulator, light-induced transcriptional regulator